MAQELQSSLSNSIPPSVSPSTHDQLLPIDKVFPIQIGSEVFRISGNALNSDSPSYFTQFFTVHSGENLKTLYIDRDPVVFKDIVRHLQGYLITPRNEEHFVYLYSDAIYYRLPRLRQRLFRDFYVRIGGKSFQVPRELFNEATHKGDSKNFFSLGFGSAMGSPFPDDKIFPQLNMENFDAEKQLRPPYMTPPALSRSAANFEDILRYLQGYEIDIRDENHRRNLIKDSKFYNLRHLTEMLVPAKTYFNPWRGNLSEIMININDFRATYSSIGWVPNQMYGWMEYKRPHDIDKTPRDLIVQIDDDGIILGRGRIMLIHRQALNALITLKEAAEGRRTEAHPSVMISGQKEVAVKIEIPDECYCLFDGVERSVYDIEHDIFDLAPPDTDTEGSSSKKRKLSEATEERVTESPEIVQRSKLPARVWMIKRSVWRVKTKGQLPPAQPPMEVQGTNPPIGGKRNMILVAVKLEGWSREKEFSKEIGWL